LALLVQKEFIEYGFLFGELTAGKKYKHKISDNRNSPAWCMFINCLHELWWEFPAAFEWNEDLLLFLMDSVLNCRFGTFLFYTEKDRLAEKAELKTATVWSHIFNNTSKYLNPFYRRCEQTLQYPSGLGRNLLFKYTRIYTLITRIYRGSLSSYPMELLLLALCPTGFVYED